MSRCKLGKHFQSLQIQGCGLFNEALFPLDVGQIVQRVCMVGTQPSSEQRVKNWAISYTLLKKHIPESGVVAIFRLLYQSLFF